MLADFPCTPLGFWPTPIYKLRHISKLLGGPEIYIKRDDHSGLATGGNKTRKLEYLLGDALARGCDTLITGGAAQSNHCRQTAAAAAACGLDCHLMLGGREPLMLDGNLLLDNLLGAHIHWCGPKRKGEDIPQLAAKLRAEGRKPYEVPYGGSNALGALGFVKAVDEFRAQQQTNRVPFSHIIFASSSGGTHAGLQIGARMHGMTAQIYGIGIDKSGAGRLPFKAQIAALANELSLMLGDKRQLGVDDITLDERFTGGGYGVVGELERKAIRTMASAEGILLDPVYTGRAFGAMLTLIAKGEFGPNDRLLFWHTGGMPALFPYAETVLGRRV